MNRDTRTLLLVLGGLALVVTCLCVVFSAVLVARIGLTAGEVTAPAPLVVTVEAVPEAAQAGPEGAEAEPEFAATATAAPAAPATSAPTTTAVPAATPEAARPFMEDLASVDLEAFREAWHVIGMQFDGPLPAPEVLHDNTVRCSVEEGLGDAGYAAWQGRLDERLAGENTSTAVSLEELDLSAYYETWDEIQREYEGELPTASELRELTIACSMATSLEDAYSRYIPPAAAARMREDMTGSFEGIGAFVRMNESDILEIVRPMDGQPADLAGLRAGDQIVAVDGENVIGQNGDLIISKVRGPRGTVVVLTILRPGLEQTFDVTIVRAQIEIPMLESEVLDPGIALVRLSSFNETATTRLAEAIASLLPQAPNGLILDLRDNPGGLLSESISVADLFLEDVIVAWRRNKAGLNESFSGDVGDLAESVPLVVLVNAGSASASEIVAGAIQDHGRAVIIGETTFGKGSVQLPHTLSDGGELFVTIARWYTPDETSIDGRGIMPDIQVPTPEDLNGPDDGQLNRAIDYLLNGQ